MTSTPAICLFSLAIAISTTGSSAPAPTQDAGYARTVLVEEGYTVPVLDLDLFFDDSRGSLRRENAALQVVSGKAALAKNGRLKQARTSVGTVPEIHAFALHEESLLRIRTGRGTITSRIVTVPAGGIEKIKAYFGATAAGVIDLGPHHALVDESKLQIYEDSGAVQHIDLSASAAGFGSTKSPGLPRTKPQSETGLCIRTPLGPGVVEWTIADPSALEWLYSVKPESTIPLIRAAAPKQDIDGVYRYYWGCGIALKVPDSCTLTINNGSASACCNAAAAMLGHVVQWINPGSVGWENCPL